MIDPRTIGPAGYAVLFVFLYIVTVCIMFLIFRSMFISALKAYTETLKAEYVRALDEFKRRHRV